LDSPFFHNNAILKQKNIARSERVRKNLKYTKGKRSARLVARSFKGWEEGKAGGRLIRNLYQRAKFVHARAIHINANWALKDTGRLYYNSSVHHFYINKMK
jgi:hypothetical protein